jgi:hypothetical protein
MRPSELGGYQPTNAAADAVPAFPGADAPTESTNASQGDVATEQIGQIGYPNPTAQGADVPPEDDNPLSAWYRKPE